MALDHTLIISLLELLWRSVNTLTQRFHALPSFLFLHPYILHVFFFVLMPSPIFAFYASWTAFVHHSFDLLHILSSFGAFGFHSLLDTVRYFALAWRCSPSLSFVSQVKQVYIVG